MLSPVQYQTPIETPEKGIALLHEKQAEAHTAYRIALRRKNCQALVKDLHRYARKYDVRSDQHRQYSRG